MLTAGEAVMGSPEAEPPSPEDTSSIDAENNALDDLLTCLGIEEAKAQV